MKYISDPLTDIDSFYADRTMLENELWTTFILFGKSVLLYGICGIGKTETAKSVLKKSIPYPVMLGAFIRLRGLFIRMDVERFSD